MSISERLANVAMHARVDCVSAYGYDYGSPQHQQCVQYIVQQWDANCQASANALMGLW